MSQINLIPNEFKLTKIRQRHFRFWLVAVLAVSLVGVMFSGFKYMKYLDAREVFRKAQDEYQAVQDEVQVLSQAKNDLSLWRDRIAVMDRLSGYHNYVSMVEYLSRHCPNLVYLEELKAGPSKEEGSPEMAMPFIPPAASMFTLNTAAQGPLSQQGVPVPPKVSAAESRMDIIYLKGHAADYEALGDLIRVMKSAVYFTNVQLQRSWRPMNLGVDTIAFEIKGNIVPGRPGDGIDYANKQQTKNF